MDLDELKEKRKKSIIVVCSLGIAALFTFKPFSGGDGYSWDDNAALKFIIKCFFYVVSSLVIMAIAFVANIFKLIYYSIEINRLRKNN